MSGTTLSLSSAYHPETDGQTENVNKVIEMYLRSTVQENPKSWIDLLPWVEMWYNTSYHHSLDTLPFQVLYGRSPPMLALYTLGDSLVKAVVDQGLRKRQCVIKELREQLLGAQQRMKH